MLLLFLQNKRPVLHSRKQCYRCHCKPWKFTTYLTSVLTSLVQKPSFLQQVCRQIFVPAWNFFVVRHLLPWNSAGIQQFEKHCSMKVKYGSTRSRPFQNGHGPTRQHNETALTPSSSRLPCKNVTLTLKDITKIEVLTGRMSYLLRTNTKHFTKRSCSKVIKLFGGFDSWI